MEVLIILGILHGLGFLVLLVGGFWAGNDMSFGNIMGLFFLWEVALVSLIYDYFKSSRHPSA